MRQYFNEYCLRLHGAPEQGFPIYDYVIYLAGSADHGKTVTAEFLTCAFLVVN